MLSIRTYQNNITTSTVVLTLLFFSALLIIGAQYLPQRIVHLDKIDDIVAVIHADNQVGGKSQFSWINKNTMHFSCHIIRSEKDTHCGLNLKSNKLLKDNDFDISSFQNLRINISYKGASKQLRLNANSLVALQNEDPYTYTKVPSSYHIMTDEFNREVVIPLYNLETARWWVSRYNISTRIARLNVKKILDIGIDIPYTTRENTFGFHDIQIKTLTLEGDWIRKSTLYLTLLCTWGLGLAIFSLYKIFNFRQRIKSYNKKIEELDRDNKELKNKSELDSLTGLLNRGSFVEKRKDVLNSKSDKPHSLIIIDIDHFKIINDTHGHIKGDKVLKIISALLKTRVRNTDIVARWGGEEFIILCPSTLLEEAAILAENMQLAIESEIQKIIGFRVTASFGVSAFNIDDKFNQVFERADSAMYRSKDDGRNRVSIG